MHLVNKNAENKRGCLETGSLFLCLVESEFYTLELVEGF